MKKNKDSKPETKIKNAGKIWKNQKEKESKEESKKGGKEGRKKGRKNGTNTSIFTSISIINTAA